tara:strand:- start:2254 stop:2985 length:732 start_codon:yes stop_codon:yes gene_type:complete
VLPNSLNKNNQVDPYLDLLAHLIRKQRNRLPGLTTIDLEPALKRIYGTFNGKKVLISNELHKSNGFRKLHLEIADLGANLKILHCVFFPDPRYDIPIFGVDLVKFGDKISAAIVDLSPVSNSLPKDFINKLDNVKRFNFKNFRELPDWGSIFSDYVLFITPENKEEENHFLELVDNYLSILLDSLRSKTPNDYNSAETIIRIDFQNKYCTQQMKNEKTRNVLAAFKSPDWADKYIEKVLFDCL